VLPLPEPEPFSFHGSAREYFRIWIVNTFLTLVSLGFFAAWAKVRKRRYLRGSLELLGHRFDYLADPRRILIGNAMIVALFLCYSLFGVVYPAVRVGTIIIALLLLPWIIVRSLAFNAHNTAYRGMRFRFHQPLSAAIMVYLFKPLLIPLTLGFYYPAWVRARRAYVINYHRLGDAYFEFDGSSGPFYLAYILAGMLIIAAAGGGMTLAMVFAGGEDQMHTPTQLLPFLLTYGLALFTAKHYLHARLFNHVWNHTKLGRHRFEAAMNINRWLGLQYANFAAVVLSCGLLYPWAVIRSARRTAESLKFRPAGTIDHIERLGGRRGSAVGESAAEFIGLDFGL
jgi:uncharacterized membrane protein YjgN (DUF898 family)